MTVGLVFDVAQVAAGVGALAFGGWWASLSAVAIKTPKAVYGAPGVRFAVLVPAHDEERLVGATVRSLLSAVYEPPPGVVVVADNCTDGTAMAAAAAGAKVIERHEPGVRGKSHALDFGVAHMAHAKGATPDVLVVVDADTTVNQEFFAALAAVVPSRAVAQARYDAAPSRSDIGRLRRLAFGLVHHARPLGARRLGLPTTLKGNGMAFRWELVSAGIPGSGITEDAEATLTFVGRGTSVHYVPSARVTGLMAEGYTEARTQDTRWEGGRFALWPRAVRTFVRQALRGRFRAAAAAAELASPPLTLVAGLAVVSLAGGLAGAGSPAIGAIAVGSVAAYVGLGLVSIRASGDDLRALVHAPRFVLHKLVALATVACGRPTSWQRTQR